MSDMRAYAYHTHYEITNYKQGECQPAEKAMSYWNPSRFERVSFYEERNNTLYLPRGLDVLIVAKSAKRPIEFVKECNPYRKAVFSMKLLPRNDVQKEAIRFLIGQDEYNYTKNASQLVLSLVGGGGKTFCAISALSFLETKMMVVVHTTELKKQWQARIKEYTTIPDDAVVTIDSTEQLLKYVKPDRKMIKSLNNHIVYIITHCLIQQFMEEYGYEVTNQIFINLGIGLKVIDEFHKNFANTLTLDYATNVYKTFYLSATAGRTSDKEDKVFQAAFNQIYKLKRSAEEMSQTPETIAVYNIFRSMLTPYDVETMYNRSNFSVHRYTDLEIYDGAVVRKTLRWLYHLFNKENKMHVDEGQLILVLSSTKDACDKLAGAIRYEFPEKKIISYYSGNKVDNVWEYDVVCATMSMMGTGNDYPNLKAIINLEAYGSAVNADQLVHRLMRGNNIGATYLIELIDGAVPNARTLYRKRRPIIDKFVTKAIEMNECKKRRS